MRTNTEQDFWSKINKTSTCWEWQAFCNPSGYGHYSWQGRNWLAHRLALHFTGVDIVDKLVCHHCDNPCCCNPEHLYAGTSKSNSADAQSRDRLWSAPGELNPNAKLTETEVLDIRTLPFKQACEKYKHISRGHICQIRYNKKAWRHV